MIRVARLRLDASHNRRWTNKARNVVDVPMRVVPKDASIEPDHLIDAEIVVKGLLQLLAAHAGIALLHFAKQALLGGEQNARAVRVDGAAFEHHPLRRAVRQLGS